MLHGTLHFLSIFRSQFFTRTYGQTVLIKDKNYLYIQLFIDSWAKYTYLLHSFKDQRTDSKYKIEKKTRAIIVHKAVLIIS